METNKNGSSITLPNTAAGKQVQARLSEERTLQALDHILARLDTLDKAVENLSTVMQQGPGLMAMGSDMIDEAYREADANGVSIDERLKNALAIAEKLTAPAMVEKLDSLLQLTDQLPGLVAMKVDAIDDVYREADDRGVSIDARLKAGLEMAEKLTAPAMVEKLDSMLQLTDQLPGLVAMKVDIIDEAYREADARGVNIDERLKAGLDMAEKLTAPAMVEQLNGLIDSASQLPGIIAMTVDSIDETMRHANESGFDPKVLAETAKAANHALTKAKAEPPANVGGIFGMLRVLKDPDRQRGLGFLMNFLKHFGKDI